MGNCSINRQVYNYKNDQQKKCNVNASLDLKVQL